MSVFLSILKFIGIFLEVLLLFNFVIFFHELGHFLAAKWRGLVVEEFAIWFGKPIWRRKIGGVWYALNSIPFGGYVKLPQLANGEIEGSSEFKAGSVPTAKPLDKIIVAAAGPIFSFLLACIFAVIVWQIGHPMREEAATTYVGSVRKDSPAEKAGMKVGDRIKSIDGIEVRRWLGQGDDAIMWRIVRSEEKALPIVVERDGKDVTLYPEPVRPEKTVLTRRKTRFIGVEPAITPVVTEVKKDSPGEKAGLRPRDVITHANGKKLFNISGIADFPENPPGTPIQLTIDRKVEGKSTTLTVPLLLSKPEAGYVEADGPAERAGIKVGDKIVSIDGKPMSSSEAIVQHIRSRGKEPIEFVVERGDKQIDPIKVTPADAKNEESGSVRPRIGVMFDDDLGIVFDPHGLGQPRNPNPGEQLYQSATAIFNTLGAVTSSRSDISIQHLGGPVMMMRIYYLFFEQPDGWKLALWFSVVLNVNLALMNLLPIPPLDGSHIVFATIAAIRRRPEAADEMANSRPIQWFVTTGTLLIIGFMLYVTFFDVQDVFGGRSNKFPYANPAEAAK